MPPEDTTPPLTPATEPNPPASTVGARLVSARKATQKNRKQAAIDLCIREDYLKALENNDSAGLPPSPYDIGFLRQYARYLELDVEPLVAEYKASRMLNFDTDELPHQQLEENAIWHSKWLLWALGGAAVLVLAVALLLDGKEESATTVPAVESATSLLPQPDEAVALQVTTPKGDVPAAEAAPKLDEASVPAEAKVEAAPAAEPAKETVKEVAPEAPKPVPAVDPKRRPLPALQAMKPEGARVRLEAASSDAWILIRPLHRDRTYVARNLPKGSSYWVTPWQNIALDTPVPQNVGVYVDGEYKGLLGPVGKEIAGLPLAPEVLKVYFAKNENQNTSAVKNPSVDKQ